MESWVFKCNGWQCWIPATADPEMHRNFLFLILHSPKLLLFLCRWLFWQSVCLLPPFVLAAFLCHCSNNWLLQMWHQGFLWDSTVSLNFWERMYFLLGIVHEWYFLHSLQAVYLVVEIYFTLILFSLWENCNRLSCKYVLMLACGFMCKHTHWK